MTAREEQQLLIVVRNGTHAVYKLPCEIQQGSTLWLEAYYADCSTPATPKGEVLCLQFGGGFSDVNTAMLVDGASPQPLITHNSGLMLPYTGAQAFNDFSNKPVYVGTFASSKQVQFELSVKNTAGVPITAASQGVGDAILTMRMVVLRKGYPSIANIMARLDAGAVYDK